MEIILILFGLLFSYLAYVLHRALSISTSDWTCVTSTVSGYVGGQGLNKRLMSAIFRIQYLGKEYFIKDPISTARPILSVGSVILVRISHTTPPQFSIASPFFKNLVHIFSALALIFFSAACLAFRPDLFSFVSLFFVAFPAWRIFLAVGRNQAARKTLSEAFQKALYPTPLSDEQVASMNYIPLTSVSHAIAAHRLQSHVVGVLLMAAGGLGLWGGEGWLRHRKTFLQSAHATSGVVVRLEAHLNNSSTSYTPVVRFREPASQHDVEFHHNVSSSHPYYKAGDRVGVLYSTDDPRIAMIDGGSAWNLLSPIAILIFSFLLLALGVKAAIL